MKLFQAFDQVLRGEVTSPSALLEGRSNVSAASLWVGVVGMGMVYGLCMASYSVFRGADEWHLQLLATMLKVPALFVLTLLITFPSLYVFTALIDSPLTFAQLFRLLTAVLGVTLIVLASLGPIVAFFAISTSSYSFMLLLNVAAFGVAGVLGVGFLMRTLRALQRFEAERVLPVLEAVPEERAEQPAGPAPQPVQIPWNRGRRRAETGTTRPGVRAVFWCWIGVYGLVGSQLGWILRPFLGNPAMPFTWLRPRESNFFEAVFRALRDLAA